jgi:hypothetical protein
MPTAHDADSDEEPDDQQPERTPSALYDFSSYLKISNVP